MQMVVNLFPSVVAPSTRISIVFVTMLGNEFPKTENKTTFGNFKGFKLH